MPKPFNSLVRKIRSEPVLLWHATLMPGKPWCVSDDVDDGYSVELYLNENDETTGIVVYLGLDIVANIGTVPVGVLEEVEALI